MGARLAQGYAVIEDSHIIHVPIFQEVGVEAVVTKEIDRGPESEAADIRVSVVLPSYNGEAYIRQQLESILGQLGKQDELIVSDDSSADGTVSIVKEYQRTDGRICLLKGPRQGIKSNVGYALSHAKGRYIFLADQDDIWLDHKVSRVLRAFEQQRASVVVHDARVFAGEDVADIQMESFFAFRGSGAGVIKNIIKNSYIGCCMAFRRDLLEVILPVPAQIEMHDQWIGILGDYFAGKSCFLPDVLLLYRRHGANNSSMEHYGLGRMLRNRLVFLWCFGRRAWSKRRRKGVFGEI